MHRKPEADLLPLDTEIERTLKNLRKVTSVESTRMENQRERLYNLFQSKKKKKRDLRGITLWRTFGGLLFKRSTLL